jgi:hypothetical protein
MNETSIIGPAFVVLDRRGPDRLDHQCAEEMR